MRSILSALSVLLLLSDVASAKAISYSPRGLRRVNDHEETMRRAVSTFDGEVERRSAASDPVSITTSGTNMNVTVAAACTSAISSMANVSNPAGFAGCYNILEWDPKTAIFQADLRIYQRAAATGQFANVSTSQISVLLTYPESTLFKALVKREIVGVVKRDGSSIQIQQYSLAGNIKQDLDVSKLNQTLLASLMVPQITLQLSQPSPSNIITTNMTVADSAWLVAGQFTELSAQAAQVANPATASAAVIAAQGFILPGTTFGIFPTGLIITSVWTLIFLLAFGLGTLGRQRSKNVYRRRVATLAARGRR